MNWQPGGFQPSGWQPPNWQPEGAAVAAVTGTAAAGIAQGDILAGGKTIIITLTGDTWVAAGAAFDAQRQAIIDGLTSAGAEAAGWNAQVRDMLAVSSVVRTSDTVVTITLSAQAGYQITASETVTVTVPAAALTAAAALVASPTLSISAPIAVAAQRVVVRNVRRLVRVQ